MFGLLCLVLLTSFLKTLNFPSVCFLISLNVPSPISDSWTKEPVNRKSEVNLTNMFGLPFLVFVALINQDSKIYKSVCFLISLNVIDGQYAIAGPSTCK